MATSSITKNFIIDSDQVETFVNALEASANDKTPRVHVNVRELTDKDEIKALILRRKRKRENATNR